MQVVKNLLSSEKAVIMILMMVAITVFVAIGKMTVAEWQNMSLWLVGIYTGGKSLQGAAAAIANGKKDKTP